MEAAMRAARLAPRQWPSVMSTMRTGQAAMSTSAPARSNNALGQLGDEETAQRLVDAKAEMVRLGYHAPSLWTQVICWGDHDQFQHVNNVHFVRFIESARMRFAEKIALDLPPERQADMLRGKGMSFILHSINVRYKRPVVYPDTLLVGSRPVVPLGDDRFSLQSGLYSVAQGAIVATGEQINVTYDYRTLKKAPIPPDFRHALEKAAGEPSA